jgi:hypothetical protein
MRCPDCHATPGETHAWGCDVERCSVCGLQRLGAPCGRSDCDRHDDRAAAWTGEWPGNQECRERGWWCALIDGAWTPVPAEHPDATPDLNRLGYFYAHGEDALYPET